MCKVRCNNCLKVFDETEIVYDNNKDTEFCPRCGKGGYLMDIDEQKLKENKFLGTIVEWANEEWYVDNTDENFKDETEETSLFLLPKEYEDKDKNNELMRTGNADSIGYWVYQSAVKEIKPDMSEKYNAMLREKYGESIAVKIKSYTEDDSIWYYYTSAKYGDSNAYKTIEEAYKEADTYLCGVSELW